MVIRAKQYPTVDWVDGKLVPCIRHKYALVDPETGETFKPWVMWASTPRCAVLMGHPGQWKWDGVLRDYKGNPMEKVV